MSYLDSQEEVESRIYVFFTQISKMIYILPSERAYSYDIAIELSRLEIVKYTVNFHEVSSILLSKNHCVYLHVFKDLK